jgi:hypothetical protein
LIAHRLAAQEEPTESIVMAPDAVFLVVGRTHIQAVLEHSDQRFAVVRVDGIHPSLTGIRMRNLAGIVKPPVVAPDQRGAGRDAPEEIWHQVYDCTEAFLALAQRG